MSIDASTRSDAGVSIVPTSAQDWQDWVSATDTRNFLLQDTVLDWLHLYGENEGFKRDTDLSGYDPRTDFTKFIFEKTREFEAAVIKYLVWITSVTTIATDPSDARKIGKVQETFAAMEAGALVLYQAVLWDAENRTYGIPDLLVRSDELRRLFPSLLTIGEATQSARDIKGSNWHYRVVDIKFTTLDLLTEESWVTTTLPGPTKRSFLYTIGRWVGFKAICRPYLIFWVVAGGKLSKVLRAGEKIAWSCWLLSCKTRLSEQGFR